MFFDKRFGHLFKINYWKGYKLKIQTFVINLPITDYSKLSIKAEEINYRLVLDKLGHDFY